MYLIDTITNNFCFHLATEAKERLVAKYTINMSSQTNDVQKVTCWKPLVVKVKREVSYCWQNLCFLHRIDPPLWSLIESWIDLIIVQNWLGSIKDKLSEYKRSAFLYETTSYLIKRTNEMTTTNKTKTKNPSKPKQSIFRDWWKIKKLQFRFESVNKRDWKRKWFRTR